MQNIHKLKILPEYFLAAYNEIKQFEIRKNDRDFKVGDYVILKEFDGEEFTGEKIHGRITYITNFEQKKGYVVFGWRRLNVIELLLLQDLLEVE